ncbi:MAG: response regulator [Burkholderiales bacterium]|nr:response regulator [Burkholderiales bacterium]
MKIAIVNDLPLAVEALRRVVALKPEHRIIWVAENGAQAVQRCAELRPDLVLMDLLMPVMDGVEATRRIMADTPCAILLVTAGMGANTARVFDAMGHGALDVEEGGEHLAGERHPVDRSRRPLRWRGVRIDHDDHAAGRHVLHGRETSPGSAGPCPGAWRLDGGPAPHRERRRHLDDPATRWLVPSAHRSRGQGSLRG